MLGGRGRAEILVAGALILAGALTDTVAFKSTLNLLLRQSEVLSWIMAAGATSMALVAAAGLGISLAVRRRSETDHGGGVTLTAAVWLLLGAAMYLVRCFVSSGSPFAFGNSSFSTVQHPALVALFFAAIYLISGVCTIYEAERLYNPEYFAYRRLGKQLRKQARITASAVAEVDRARSALDHHAGELDREDHRRKVAIAERQSLGTEAANYARYLMATMLADPAKTGLTETGPLPPGAADGEEGKGHEDDEGRQDAA